MPSPQAASRQPDLWREYEQLLASRNLQVPSADIDPAWEDRIKDEMRASALREGVHLSPEDLARLPPLETTGFSFQGLLDRLSDEIEAAIAKTAIEMPFPVLAAEFPTGHFNAHALKTPSGALLLVNSGLFPLLHQAVKVMLLSIGLASPSGAPDSYRLPPELTPAQTEDALARLILAYFLAGDSRHAPRFPMLGGRRGNLGGALLHRAEMFVVAHEYGHVIAGHLNDNRVAAIASLVGDLEVVDKNWDQEIEADAIALGILRRDTPDEIPSHAVLGEVQAVAAAPVFAMVLNHIVDRVGSEVLNRTLVGPASHPPALWRADGFRSQFASMGGDAVAHLADLCMKWGEDVVDPVVARATETCSEHGIK